MGTYVITGSASGLGAATRARLEAEGNQVIGVDLHDSEVIANLSSADGRSHAIAAITKLADGPIDGLVPFAGSGPRPGQTARDMIELNYLGSIVLVEGLREQLALGCDPAVVLISSASTTTGIPWPKDLASACLAGDVDAASTIADSHGNQATRVAYPATKAALAYYARTHAAGYLADGIRLNAVAPGFIETPATIANGKNPLIATGIAQYLASTPAGRAGVPAEVAAAVTFLLGSTASFIVGSVLNIDGGMEANLRGTDWPQSPATST